jgi:hypothetical protein
MGPRSGFITIVGTQMLPEAVLDGLFTAPLYVLLTHIRLLPAPRPDGPSLADDA